MYLQSYFNNKGQLSENEKKTYCKRNGCVGISMIVALL